MHLNSAPVFFKGRHESPSNSLSPWPHRSLLLRQELTTSNREVCKSNDPPLFCPRKAALASHPSSKQQVSSSDPDSPSLSNAGSLLSDTHKIPKPCGEVARPGRGGYTLKHVVRMDDKHFKRIQVSVLFDELNYPKT